MKFKDLVKNDVIKVWVKGSPEKMGSISIVKDVKEYSVNLCDLKVFNGPMELNWEIDESDIVSLELLFHYPYSPETELIKRFPEYSL